MSVQVDPRLVALAIEELPALVGWIRGQLAKDHPDVKQPTSEEVLAGLQEACASSLAKDASWLAAHPQGPA